MESLQKALSHLRTWYKNHGGPSYPQIADTAGVSESTVQRYLSGEPVKRPNYTTIVSIGAALGMTTSDLSLSEDVVQAMEKSQLESLALELRKLNIEELSAQREADDARWRERLNADQEKYLGRIELLNKQHAEEMIRLKDAHAEEMKRTNDAHESHIMQIHRMYDGQMESMRAANAKQVEAMLDGHARQIEAVQKLDQAQQDAVQIMAAKQKEADEKSKDFLKGRIEQLDKRSKTKDRIIFSLLAVIFLLFVVDFLHPSLGWIRRISTTLFSYHNFA